MRLIFTNGAESWRVNKRNLFLRQLGTFGGVYMLTVKVPNFGHHEYFEFFFSEEIAMIKTRPTYK
jgi:hypothetical protein